MQNSQTMIKKLTFAEPFFSVTLVQREDHYQVHARTIVINLSEIPIAIQRQQLPALQSVIVAASAIKRIDNAVLVENFESYLTSYGDASALFAEVRKSWQLAYDVRKEERLKGVSHYMSPKAQIDNLQLSMYHSNSVPLNVGLHKVHTHCGDYEPKEIHTQLVGLGKMQQCREQDISTLYLEETMAPGITHKPMFDSEVTYPWHQYETITPSIFMAIEIKPEQSL